MSYVRWTTSSLDKFLMIVGAITMILGVPAVLWHWYETEHPCIRRGPGKCSNLVSAGDIQIWTITDCEVCVERK